jgi:hypothetical protein
MTGVELDIPRVLPIDHLSVSSISTFLKCPERWRRRYIDREYEPPSGAMILGSAVGAAEGHAFQEQVDEKPRPSTDDVLDLFAEEFDERAGRDEVEWNGETPGEVKDVGVKAVTAYEREIVPAVKPVSVERQFVLDFDGVDWTLEGYLDLEEDDGAVGDLKVRKNKLSPADAASDMQVASYLLARRAEGNPASEFRFHTMVKTKMPYAELVPTSRTDAQLDAFADRVYRVAGEIHWRVEHDQWEGAVPGSWWCSERMCGFWGSCPMGGAA